MSTYTSASLPEKVTVRIMYWRRNNYLLSSSRKVEIAKGLDMEEAWNYGASVSTYVPVFGKTLNINAYFCCFFLISCLNSLGEQPKLFLQYLLKPAAELKPNSYATSFIEMKS